MKIKNISNMWKGRLKRRNFLNANILVGIIYVFILSLFNNVQALMQNNISTFFLLIPAYVCIISLSVRRAKDIGISPNKISVIVTIFVLGIICDGLLLIFPILNSSHIYTTYFSLPSFLISIFLNLYLLFANSEKKDNIYGVYEEHTKKSFINDIFNR